MKIKDCGSIIAPKLEMSINALWVQDTDSKKRYSFINLSLSRWSGSTATYMINELYEGEWITSVKEKIYTCCTVQMSGLALWINKPLLQMSPKKNKFLFEAKHEFEQEMSEIKGLSIVFRKFLTFQSPHLQLNIQERASLVLTSNHPESRLYFNNLLKSLQNLISIFLHVVPKIWEIEYTSQKEQSSNLKLAAVGENEQQERSDVTFFLDHITPAMIKLWYSISNKLNEICSLLTEARENKTPETAFTYTTKSLELIYKYLIRQSLAPGTIDEVVLKMKDEGIWDNDWKNPKSVLPKTLNFRIVLCILWEMFSGKAGITSDTPYKMLRRVHNSRNFYTHFDYGEDVYEPSQLIPINRLLIAFSYGLIIQHLGFDEKNITRFTKANASFAFYSEFDSNPYSIHYKEQISE